MLLRVVAPSGDLEILHIMYVDKEYFTIKHNYITQSLIKHSSLSKQGFNMLQH